MALLGAIVNGLAIICGSCAGFVLRHISEQTKDTVMKGISIGVIALGIQMVMGTKSFTIVLICLCLGALLGEWWKIEDRINQFGLYLERRFAKGGSRFAEGFVTATLIFVIGSMGIIGAIESGASGNHSTLFTKSVMDGFMAIMLTASIGVGVMFSAVPVFLYQGAIALLANVIVNNVPQDLMSQLMTELSALGGIMIVAIGFNVMGVVKIRVSNYLPGMVLILLYYGVQYYH